VTDFADATLAGILSLLINLWIVVLIRRQNSPAEGIFLTRVYVLTLLLRHAGAILLNAFAGNLRFADAFWGDSDLYDWGGYGLALKWAGESYLTPGGLGLSGYGFTYFVGAVYYVFGRNQLLVQFLNATIGALAVLAIYGTARLLFGEGSARWAATFMAFFPQMIFWSCAMYKDPAVLLCIAVSIYAVLRLRLRFEATMLTLFVAAALTLITLRFYVFYMVAAATVGTFLFAQRRSLVGGLLGQIALVVVFGSAMVLGVRSETLRQQSDYFQLGRLQIARADQARQAESGYGSEINVSTPQGAIAALPRGLAYLFFAPFPWAAASLRQSLVLPEMLVWYALLPSFVRGLRYALTSRLRDCLPIVVFALLLTVSYAVFQSNVGTVYRQRTQISMFFFIFMGVGLELRRNERERRAWDAQAPPP
jgi:4-amino-4-deoxy-L-arabinose transferase-like glycosyltransferase